MFSGLDLLLSLRKTARFGQMITMTGFLTSELGRYFVTFGTYFVYAIIIGTMIGLDLKVTKFDFYNLFLDLFQAYTSQQNFDIFKYPVGKIYIAVFVFLF